MAITVQRLRGTLELDASGYQQGLQRAGQAQRRFSSEAEAANQVMDRLGDGFRQAGLQADRGASVAQRALSRIGDGARAAGRAFAAFGQTARTALSSIGQGISALSGQVFALGAALTAAGGLGIAGGFTAIARRGVDMNLALNGAHAAFTRILGSAPAAARFVGLVQEEAARSIPTFKELLAQAAPLAMAYGPQGIGRVIPTLRAFGDAARGNTGGMELALLGFRQLLNRGVVQQEELNQIGENLGVNITGILTRAFGTADTETLQKANITGRQVADAIVSGLEREFGGAQAMAARTIPGLLSNIEDAFDRFSQQATVTLVPILERVLTKVLQVLTALASNARIIQALSRIFESFGRILEWVAGQLPAFVEWVAQILERRQSFEDFLFSTASLFQTIVQSVLKLVGVDLGKVFNPETIARFFEGLTLGTRLAVHGFFGMGRVFQEIGRFILSKAEDIGDAIGDMARMLRPVFQVLFEVIEAQAKKLGETVVNSLKAIAGAINLIVRASPMMRAIMGSGIKMEDFQGLIKGLWDRTPNANFLGALQSIGQGAQLAWQMDQPRRDRWRQKRLQQDPFRDQDFGTRMADAFSGRGRDVNGELDFFRQWDVNFQGMRQFFNPPQAPTPYQPELLFPGRQRGWSVRTYPAGPEVPSMPDWRGGGGGNTLNMPINILGFNREEIHREIDRRLDELQKRAGWGPEPGY